MLVRPTACCALTTQSKEELKTSQKAKKDVLQNILCIALQALKSTGSEVSMLFPTYSDSWNGVLNMCNGTVSWMLTIVLLHS